MRTAHVEAVATGVLTVCFLVVAVVSFRSQLRAAWRLPAVFGVLLGVALTVAELHGVVFSGPGGHHGISVP